jgi:hypothetical protein
MKEMSKSTDQSTDQSRVRHVSVPANNSTTESGTATVDHCRRRSSIWLDSSDRNSDEELQEELRREVTNMSPHEIISQIERMAMSNTSDGQRKMSALKQIMLAGDVPPVSEIKF